MASKTKLTKEVQALKFIGKSHKIDRKKKRAVDYVPSFKVEYKVADYINDLNGYLDLPFENKRYYVHQLLNREDTVPPTSNAGGTDFENCIYYSFQNGRYIPFLTAYIGLSQLTQTIGGGWSITNPQQSVFVSTLGSVDRGKLGPTLQVFIPLERLTQLDQYIERGIVGIYVARFNVRQVPVYRVVDNNVLANNMEPRILTGTVQTYAPL